MNSGETRKEPVLGEIAEMWAFAREAGIDGQLKALHRPRPVRTCTAALLDWLVIGLAAYAVAALGWWFAPLAILLIGNRQRALGNLLHDAAHHSLHRDRSVARWLSNVFLCWPLWINMTLYRKEHTAHHNHLADPALDPDYIHGDSPQGTPWPRIALRQLASATMFRNALLGHLGRVSASILAGSYLWWAGLLTLIGLAFSPAQAACFLALWIAARASSFHVITAIREISDHVGLVPGTLIGFSRNHAFGGAAAQLLHPHNNGYHLLHHLAPRMPFHAFPRAHVLLMGWPRYARGCHCDSYLFGEEPAVRSWQGEGGGR